MAVSQSPRLAAIVPCRKSRSSTFPSPGLTPSSRNSASSRLPFAIAASGRSRSGSRRRVPGAAPPGPLRVPAKRPPPASPPAASRPVHSSSGSWAPFVRRASLSADRQARASEIGNRGQRKGARSSENRAPVLWSGTQLIKPYFLSAPKAPLNSPASWSSDVKSKMPPASAAFAP